MKAWIARAEGKTDEAIRLLQGRRCGGQLLPDANRPADALAAYEKLLALVTAPAADRPEIREAKTFVGR